MILRWHSGAHCLGVLKPDRSAHLVRLRYRYLRSYMGRRGARLCLLSELNAARAVSWSVPV